MKPPKFLILTRDEDENEGMYIVNVDHIGSISTDKDLNTVIRFSDGWSRKVRESIVDIERMLDVRGYLRR